ncbi:winged helix-turn-helix transcriptional regulator [Spongiactinospora sp. 9N601]|uniref:winged helix-turn-helix transcriptional regulator n=1 Tax=Spongiactinospora sp. 9N601 TaxID=3375149 RepID=UPI0037B726FA
MRRYGDFLTHLKIPRAVLSQRLSALVEAGVLRKSRYRDSPPRHEYVVTEMGQELWPVVFALARWGERHLSADRWRIFLHQPCGVPLEPNAACSGCGVVPALREIEMRPAPEADHTQTDPVSIALRRPRRLLEPLVP